METTINPQSQVRCAAESRLGTEMISVLVLSSVSYRTWFSFCDQQAVPIPRYMFDDDDLGFRAPLGIYV